MLSSIKYIFVAHNRKYDQPLLATKELYKRIPNNKDRWDGSSLLWPQVVALDITNWFEITEKWYCVIFFYPAIFAKNVNFNSGATPLITNKYYDFKAGIVPDSVHRTVCVLRNSEITETDPCTFSVDSADSCFDTFGRGFDGRTVCFQRLPNEPNTSTAHKDLSRGDNQQQESPFRHVLLGLEVCLSTLGVVCGFCLIIFGWAKLSTEDSIAF